MAAIAPFPRRWLNMGMALLLLFSLYFSHDELSEALGAPPNESNEVSAGPEKQPESKPARKPKKKKWAYDDCRKRCVYLTFDDGPWPDTHKILSILRKHKVKATFFVLGRNIENFPRETARLLESGQLIANHTWDHPNMTYLSPAARREQARRTSREIKKTFGYAPKCFRPPYGATNKHVEKEMRREKLEQVMWDVDPQDWRLKPPSALASHVISHTRPGSTIILHDGGGDRTRTIAALPKIIKGLKEKGYGFSWVPACKKRNIR